MKSVKLKSQETKHQGRGEDLLLMDLKTEEEEHLRNTVKRVKELSSTWPEE